MARAIIKDVAAHAGLSISTVNRALHEPDKVREETLLAVVKAAEEVGFYGAPILKRGLGATRPKVTIGILLLQRKRAFYQNLARALQTASSEWRDHEITIRIDYLDELTPQNVSNGLLKLGEVSNVVGVVAPEHPTVAAAIEQLSARGIKTFALVSQLTARCNVGYIGLDAWKVGRTAGWAFDNLCKAPGKIGILVGNHRYRCQESNESGFRSYFREHQRGFELLEAQSTFETASIAQEITEILLDTHKDLAGLYVSGGGITGAISALKASRRTKDVIMVGYDLTEVTRTGLIEGTINFLISHPLQALANQAISAMISTIEGGVDYPAQSIMLPFEIFTSENI